MRTSSRCSAVTPRCRRHLAANSSSRRPGEPVQAVRAQVATVLAVIEGALPLTVLDDPTAAVRGQFAAGLDRLPPYAGPVRGFLSLTNEQIEALRRSRDTQQPVPLPAGVALYSDAVPAPPEGVNTIVRVRLNDGRSLAPLMSPDTGGVFARPDATFTVESVDVVEHGGRSLVQVTLIETPRPT